MYRKLEQINIDGIENLQVVLDFDRTITYGQKMDGQTPSMISFLRLSNMLGEEYYKLANANFRKYNPIETDTKIDPEEQRGLMQHWWEEHLSQVKDFNLTIEQIKEIAYSPQLILRPGMFQLFKFCELNKVPIIIFSANVLGKESITFFLDRFGINLENIFIITNELYFNSTGKIIDFKKPVIHSRNKNVNLISADLQRTNTILIGDNISDATMANDTPTGTVFRVATLDDSTAIKLAEYADVFDMIIHPNSSFDILKLVDFLRTSPK